MNIIKQVDNYALIEQETDVNESLRFYVDNGTDVSELFDEMDAEWIANLDGDTFKFACETRL